MSGTVTWLLAIIAGLLSITALRLAQDLLAPIALGLVCSVVLGPPLTRLARMGVPRGINATGALLASIGVFVLMVAAIGPIIGKLMQVLPQIEREAQWWFRKASNTLRGLDIDMDRTIAEEGEEAVKDAVPNLIEALWLAPNFMGQFLIFAGTLFFFLLTRDEIYDKLASFETHMRRADRAVSHYFVTVTMINACLGGATAGAMMLIGLPSPMLWGFAAFILNFLLYLGPIAMICALAIAGMTQFTGIQSVLPPVAFLCLNLTEAQFATPTLVGQRLKINPLAVFLSIIFGLWLWGPLGSIIALPAMIWIGAFFGRIGAETPGAEPAEDTTVPETAKTAT
ncbi:hypothetical protein AVJ23_11945 [Pseudoponticoccus marisrubri]|uniref:Permease n=1 Tax=Pseudoponticoccus marisrubri TaxID=1685382 RepID=A0A0W7WJA4_9RHOB|nr:hypothetical protein AVJ23_11945 [Pseudoponticoccus marisrubri]